MIILHSDRQFTSELELKFFSKHTGMRFRRGAKDTFLLRGRSMDIEKITRASQTRLRARQRNPSLGPQPLFASD
jgi:hypothetical protein